MHIRGTFLLLQEVQYEWTSQDWALLGPEPLRWKQLDFWPSPDFLSKTTPGATYRIQLHVNFKGREERASIPLALTVRQSPLTARLIGPTGDQPVGANTSYILDATGEPCFWHIFAPKRTVGDASIVHTRSYVLKGRMRSSKAKA
jgi:hypothetical protein